MNNTSVNILGTKYNIYLKSIKDDKILEDSDGYIDETIKKIVVLKKPDNCEVEDFEYYQRKVLRHEIIHGYFYESGLAENLENKQYGVSETLVDWIAMQSPKIYKTFKKLNILE